MKRVEANSKKGSEDYGYLERKFQRLQAKSEKDEAHIKKLEGDYDRMAKTVHHDTARSQEMHYIYKRRINQLLGLLEDAQVDVPRNALDDDIPPSAEAARPLSKVLDNGPPQIHEIDYGFEVMALTEDGGFHNISSEDKLSSAVCSTIAESANAPARLLSAMITSLSGGPRDEDTEWMYVNKIGVEDWFDLGQKTEKSMRALTYRVRVYLCKKQEGEQARKVLERWSITEQT